MSRFLVIVSWLFIIASAVFAAFQMISPAKAGSDGYEPRVYRDTLTGCEYLATYHDGALAPRIDVDGRSHMGCKGAAK